MARTLPEKQGSFAFVGWGGKRARAGRPKKPGARLRHASRTPLAARYPVHVTLRTLPGSPNLRRASIYAAVEAALRPVRERADFHVVHFSVQSNHLHLLVEARGAAALSRGMQGLAIRIARGVNRLAGRAGKLWADRFHARVLRSPREVRAALCYVLQNTRRHATTERNFVDPSWIDPRSSGPWFDGWRTPDVGDRVKNLLESDARVRAAVQDQGARRGGDDAPAARVAGGEPPTSRPRTWLLATGWRRCGLIRVDEVPAAAFA